MPRTLPVLLIVCLVAGCDRGARETTSASLAPGSAGAKAKTTLPVPDALRISYDAGTRTLRLYDLDDDQAHWMMTTPRNLKGEPVATVHVFTGDVDLDRTALFTTHHGLKSPPITLRDVLTTQVAQKK